MRRGRIVPLAGGARRGAADRVAQVSRGAAVEGRVDGAAGGERVAIAGTSTGGSRRGFGGGSEVVHGGGGDEAEREESRPRPLGGLIREQAGRIGGGDRTAVKRQARGSLRLEVGELGVKLSIRLAAAVTDGVVVAVVRCPMSCKLETCKVGTRQARPPKDATHPAVTVWYSGATRGGGGAVVDEWWGCTDPHTEQSSPPANGTANTKQ